MPTAHTSVVEIDASPNTWLVNPTGPEVGATWKWESQRCGVAVALECRANIPSAATAVADPQAAFPPIVRARPAVTIDAARRVVRCRFRTTGTNMPPPRAPSRLYRLFH